MKQLKISAALAAVMVVLAPLQARAKPPARAQRAEGVGMEMQQIRYFLALCEEPSFTRAARQCGISQPSLTNAIIRLEQELGGPLFERKPAVAPTVLGHAVHPYLQRIAENADLARGTAQALVNVRLAGAPVEQLVATLEAPGVD